MKDIPPRASLSRETALAAYQRIRHDSESLCEPLENEDYIIQAAPEASPTKWHLAHVSWYFETFLLSEFLPGYKEFHPLFRHLFNSYYEQVDEGYYPRPQRGFLSRPTVAEVYQYRAHIDANIAKLVETAAESDWPEIANRLLIGVNHEQQHQELLLTDIKYNLAVNPLTPAYHSQLSLPLEAREQSLRWIEFDGGLHRLGFDGDGFAYDNEFPAHQVFVQPFRLASRLVTNSEYLAFIDAGGYEDVSLWLSDGWQAVQSHRWRAPLHWIRVGDEWQHVTLGGLRPLDLHAPVCHVSYYEADAYARWTDKRLPTEAEWETAVADLPMSGNFRDQGYLQPVGLLEDSGLTQMYGDVWEWTQSPYTPYPGFRPVTGALGEYNGKFMCNQMVLRGGSCVTPQDHIRPTYRNFFYPHERWQFKGFRLAEDV